MNTTKSSVTCTNCGGQLLFDDDQVTVTCEYCGSQFLVSDLLDESDAVQLEKLRQRAAREKEKRKEEQRQQNEGKRFQKSFFGILCIAFSVFCAVITIATISSGFFLIGILGVVQSVLFLAGFLFGAKLVKPPFPKAKVASLIIAFALFVPNAILLIRTAENESFPYGILLAGIFMIEILFFVALSKLDKKEKMSQNNAASQKEGRS